MTTGNLHQRASRMVERYECYCGIETDMRHRLGHHRAICDLDNQGAASAFLLSLPGQAALDFQIERKAQEGSDQDNAPKDANALKGRGGGDGTDDVTCDEKLQSEENRTPEPHTLETRRRTDIFLPA